MSSRVNHTLQAIPQAKPISITTQILIVEGKKFQITTEIIRHTCLWQVAKGVQAFFITLITAGFALFIPRVRNMWKQAFTGKEIKVSKAQLSKTPKFLQRRPPSLTHTPRELPKDRQLTGSPLSSDSDAIRADRLKVPVGTLNGKQAFFASMPSPEAQAEKRKAVKQSTIAAVQASNQIPRELRAQPPRLFISQDSAKTYSKPTQLFGRFDSIAVPCRMDYDFNWDPIQQGNLFWVQHGAAPNIGERRKPEEVEDYKDYFENQSLLEDDYLEDIGICIQNMLKAQRECGVKHVVWFPFGMGAFLRNLPALDRSYEDPEEMLTLKKKIATVFVEQFVQFPELQIHLCVPMTKDKTDESFNEMNQTYNAFVVALSEHTKGDRHILLYTNCDACHIAQQLANMHGDYTVSLANGANRNLIGNHWFQEGALRAIDENLHRRSTLLAKTAHILNGGFKLSNGNQGTALAKRIAALKAGRSTNLLK